MLPNGTVYRKPFVWEVGQGCPESRNVKVLFGAKGDGITNDYGERAFHSLLPLPASGPWVGHFRPTGRI